MKKSIIIFTCVLIITSCNEFLTEDIRSEVDLDTFLENPELAEGAVNILYRQGFPSFYSTPINGASVLMNGGFLAGLFDNQYKGEFIVRLQGGNVDAGLDNQSLENIWNNSYIAISRFANFAIKYLPEVSGLEERKSKQLVAEARFFRALNYFYLVKMFGAVPLITEPYESPDDVEVRRSSEEKIYRFIVQDLNEALNNGELADTPMPLNNFRISKGSVSALLADVYLNLAGFPVNDNSMYTKAANIAEKLINNPNYKLIENENINDRSAYSIIRTSDVEDEYLYTVEFDDKWATGGGYPMFNFPQEASSWNEFPRYDAANLGYNPVSLLHMVYDDQDLRYKEKQYFHSKYEQVNGPNAGVIREFGTPIPYFWFEKEAALETGISTKDKVHYRLAEVYLIAAEAIAKVEGVTENAAQYLAEIQSRASLNKNTDKIKSELLLLSKEEFIKEVWREKIRELIFEYKIWNDITRTQMYPAVNSLGDFDFVDLIGAVNPFGGKYTLDNIYLPIGELEIQRNPLLLEPPID